MYGDEEKRYEGYANKIGKTLNNLNGWERQIWGIMLFYSFKYKQAVYIYYQDKEEANKIITMSRSEFLQHLKDRQQESIEYRKKSKEGKIRTTRRELIQTINFTLRTLRS